MPFTAWPATSKRTEPYVPAEGPEPGVGPLAGPRWLYVWNRGLLDECACWRGAVRKQGNGWVTATEGSCTSPGKHPWIKRQGGDLVGFEHGAASALDYAEVFARFGPPGGARQLAVVLDDVLVIDLDSPRALRDFARCRESFKAAKDRLLGVSTSPRGFHVWLDCPGWNQRGLNRWMAQWLINWHGTDEKVAGQRGFCYDVRTGFNRYVVWPGQHPARRWINPGEFWERLSVQLGEYTDPRDGKKKLAIPAHRLAPTERKAPWQVDLLTDETVAKIVYEDAAGEVPDISDLWLTEDGSVADAEKTWAELESWCARLLKMEPGSGRNNALNALGFFAGTRCIAAGHSPESVEAKIIETGTKAGTHGIRATTASGLRAGLALVAKARQAVA